MNSKESNKQKDNLRQYLLGLLPESSREAIDHRILTDSEFYEELESTEVDLIDEYFSGTLTERERQQFEVHFAIGKERQNKVQFARSWRNHLQQNKVPDLLPEASFASFVNTAKGSNRRSILAFAICLLVLVGGVAVWLVHLRSGSEGSPQQTLAVTLSSGASRSGGQATTRLKQPPAKSLVNIELELASNDHSYYQVELSRENESIKPFKNLQAQARDGHYVVVVPVDSALLNVGDYTFNLTGLSQSVPPESKGTYHLRVIP